MKRAFAAVLAAACLPLAGCGGTTHHQDLHGGRPHTAAFTHDAEHAGLPVPTGLTISPFISGYDAVTASNIPGGAHVVGCYTSGRFANCPTVRARFPRAHILTIATWDGASGRILDTEPGDATPSEDPAWIDKMISEGIYHPGIYADAAEMSDVRADLNADRIPRASYVLWVADWDGNPTIPSGYNAIQWKSTATLDYDSFSTSFFTAKPKPKPVLPVCVHHRMSRAACTAAKKLVAKRRAAASSTAKALTGINAALKSHQCRKPYRRHICRRLGGTHTTLAKREQWFTSHANSLAASL